MILDRLAQHTRELTKRHEALVQCIEGEIAHQEELAQQIASIIGREPEGAGSITWEAFKQQIATLIPRHRMALLMALVNAADSAGAEKRFEGALLRAQLANGKKGMDG